MWSAPVHAALTSVVLFGCKDAECLQVFYAFSGREVVQPLASQPESSKNMCRHRDHSAAGCFGSTDAKRIDQATG